MKNEDKDVSSPFAGRLEDVLVGRNWKSALFTTFSISLSFFEAYVLPKLEDAGCSDISILVDSRFYKQSLSERQAVHIGKSYQLYPIECAGQGVFHPKVSYLSSEDYDVIAVSSGNLTHAGHGLNLECIDFVVSDRDVLAFRQFGDFLTAIIESPNINVGTARAQISRFSRRAGTLGKRESSEKQVHLLHNVRTSIGDQVSEYLANDAPLNALTCASPFHHSRGQAIGRLAANLGAKTLNICVDPRTGCAPFSSDALASGRFDVRYVALDAEEKRHLHAKWYEFEGKKLIVLSGSVNATHQSMWTTDSIEVALVREVKKEQLPRWKEITPIGFESPEFEVVGKDNTGTIVCMVEDDILRGQVSNLHAPEGIWDAAVSNRFVRTNIGQVKIDSDGQFETPFTAGADSSNEAFQLRLVRGKDCAVGWVDFADFLNDSVENRGVRLALSRISGGLLLENDVRTIVRTVVGYLQRISGGPVDVPPEESILDDENDDGGESKKEAALETAAKARCWEHRKAHNGTDSESLLRRALAILSRSSASVVGGINKTSEVDKEDENGDRHCSTDRFFEEINFLLSFIEKTLDENPGIPFAVDLALFKLEILFRKPASGEFADVSSSRAAEWLRWLGRLLLRGDQKRRLFSTAATVAACAVSNTSEARKPALAAEMKQLLRAMGITWSLESLQHAIEVGLSNRALSFLPELQRTRVLEHVRQIWESRSVGDELKALLQQVDSGNKLVISDLLRQTFSPETVQAFLDNHRSSGPRYGQFTSLEGVLRCPLPKCGFGVNGDEVIELKHRFAIKCRRCSYPLIWLGNQ